MGPSESRSDPRRDPGRHPGSPPSATRIPTPTRSDPRSPSAWRPNGSARRPRSWPPTRCRRRSSHLPLAGEVRTRPQLEPDLAVVVDGPLNRTGAIAAECGDWLARARIANIDHHVSNDGQGVSRRLGGRGGGGHLRDGRAPHPGARGRDRRADRDRADRRDRPGHPHLLAPERDAPDAPRRRRPRRVRGAAVADPPRDLRQQAVQHARAVGPDPGRSRRAATTGGSCTRR